MAVSDIRLTLSFPDHPKTKKLLRRGGAEAVWRLVCLFIWTAGNRTDGNLAGLSDEDIELAVDWSGEPGSLVNLLSDVGYLDGEEGRRSIHDWLEHNPWVAGAKARSAKAKHAQLTRDHGRVAADRMMKGMLADHLGDDPRALIRSSPIPPEPDSTSLPHACLTPPTRSSWSVDAALCADPFASAKNLQKLGVKVGRSAAARIAQMDPRITARQVLELSEAYPDKSLAYLEATLIAYLDQTAALRAPRVPVS